MLRVMKIYLFIMFIFSLNLSAMSDNFAKQYKYELDYEVAVQKAKSLNKPIMMVLSTKSCSWCRKFERQTLKKDMINKIVSDDFVALALDRDHGKYPKEFTSKVVPTVVFIDAKSSKEIIVSYGYKNKKVFKKVLLKVIQEYK